MQHSDLPDPVVARAGSDDPSAPLVVLLHGRGSNEAGIIGLADYLPRGLSYAAVRAPIAEGGGFAWFANRGIGRPVAESLAQTMAWFRSWLDQEAPEGRPVILVGFSGGAAFAGGLLLGDPKRFAAAAILYGTLPFDAGVPVEPGRLFGLPVFVAQGEQDHVIPRELLDRTWDYINGDSGSPAWSNREPGGHQITESILGQLGGWIQERLAYVARHGATALPPAEPAWPTIEGGALPARQGERPVVTVTTPQQQTTDIAPAELQERVFEFGLSLAGVSTAHSAISVPGARGLRLDEPGDGPAEAFLVPSVREFAHVHPREDGSMHLALPVELAADAIRKGWAVAHPLACIRLTPGFVMVYGPRDDRDYQVVTAILAASHAYARGGPAGGGPATG